MTGQVTVTRLCRGCDMTIELTDYGWVHVNAGGACMQKCVDCGWKGSKPGSYFACPDCGSPQLVDDHIAAP